MGVSTLQRIRFRHRTFHVPLIEIIRFGEEVRLLKSSMFELVLKFETSLCNPIFLSVRSSSLLIYSLRPLQIMLFSHSIMLMLDFLTKMLKKRSSKFSFLSPN